jgi:multidrug resistance efflux pump
MLSDYLETPNLRAKAFKTLWDWVAGRARNRPFREQRPLMIYAIAAMLFSTSLLVYVYAVLYKWTTSNWALAGLVAFALFVVLTARRAAAEPMAGLKAIASRAALKKWRNFGILAAVLVASFVFRWELKVSARFSVLPQNTRIVPAEIDGTIVEVPVHEGTRVQKGDLLARLSVPLETQLAIKKIYGDIDTKGRALDDLNAGKTANELLLQRRYIDRLKVERDNVRRNSEKRKQQQAVLGTLKVQLAGALSHRDRQRTLAKEGLTAPATLEAAETDVKVIEGQIHQAEQALKVITEEEDRQYDNYTKEIQQEDTRLLLMMDPPRSTEVQRLLSEINALKDQLAVLNLELEKSEIRAPIDGVVSTSFPEQKVSLRLEAGDEVLRLVEAGELIAQMSVPEKELGEVRMGLPVWMTPNTAAGQRFEGRVDSIAAVAHTQDGQQMVAVRSKLLSDNEALIPGTTGVAKIYCGKHRIIYIATRRIRIWINTDLWNLLPF